MSAAAIEKAIEEAVVECKSLRARGLWFTMLAVIKANRADDEPTEGEFTFSLDRIASIVGKSDAIQLSEKRASAKRLVSFLRRVRVDGNPLIQQRRSGYFLAIPYAIARERFRVQQFAKALRYAKRCNVTPKADSPPKDPVSPENGKGLALRYTKPPEVFSPTPPLSFPPNYLSAREEISGRPDPEEIPDEIVKSAFSAFELWSRKSRDYGLVDVNNEIRKVREMLEIVNQNPPIILPAGTAAKQPSVVPQAVDVLIKSGLDFTRIDFACKCVRNKLEDWQRKGMPGSHAAQGNGKPAQAPLTKSVERNYRPAKAQRSHGQ